MPRVEQESFLMDSLRKAPTIVAAALRQIEPRWPQGRFAGAGWERITPQLGRTDRSPTVGTSAQALKQQTAKLIRRVDPRVVAGVRYDDQMHIGERACPAPMHHGA